MTDATAGATLTRRRQDARPALVNGDRGQRRLRRLLAAQGDRPRHARRRLRQHRVAARQRSPTSTATRASCATAATRSSSWPRSRRFLEVAYLLIYGELPTPGRARRLRPADPPPHAAARGPQGVLRRLPARRAPDAGAVVGGVRAVDLLPGQPRPVRPRAGRDLHRPAAGQAADHRGLRLQEVRRPAVPLPGQLAVAASRTSCG